ncbi:MAG: DNA helicase RecQ [Alphaproteobacteria bacterium]|nr:DNA helicase RecQ [Alphaproteobacteria bacterium]MBO6864324.1 DNA helicase RecQ [Alphaproteobacteria bacterium]MEC9264596.1 DNA helicase RecQ [Pseudomonadota bacterium]
MRSSPQDVLAGVFGFQGFRPGQEEIVDRLLAGTHTLTVMPTGAGKSLCYQVPALIFDRPSIVVSPLVALMDDQVAGLRANGVDAACIHSGQSREQNVDEWMKVRNGTAKLLYMSPERLMTDRMLAALERLNPAMFVVDEAHCISKWGASFRPEYEMLSALTDRFPDATMAAFTATADNATRRDIAEKLFRSRGDIVVHGFDRPNLTLGVTPKVHWKKQLMAFLDARRGQAGIVYCLSRRMTDEVAEMLTGEGIRALPYHAGLPPEVRKENQDIFMTEDAVVMVATIAFGMGIDKPDIRFVFHLNLPGSMEAYYQEIGRAGRDGNPSEVQMLFGLDDIRMRRQFIDQDGENSEHKLREHKRLDALLAYCEATRCRRAALLSYFGEDGEACGNCDTCLDPPVLIDGTREAQMLLSAIARTGQAFGAAHIIDILRGAKTAKIEERGHDSLPTFGIGADHDKPFWQAFIRQAVAGGYLSINIEGYGGLVLTRTGEAVLKGEESFTYREIPKSTKPARSERRSKVEMDTSDIDGDLLASLKALRRDLAAERNVPAYIVFGDATLIDMCRMRPETLDQMSLVNGVGPKKLQDFGPAFLRALSAGAA